MKVIIAGSREIDDYPFIKDTLDNFNSMISEVVSGNAKGVDQFGEKWAEENNKSWIKFKAHWDEYGKSAGVIRNRLMAEYADYLIAFWDGESRGTKNMIETMHNVRKSYTVIFYNKNVNTSR